MAWKKPKKHRPPSFYKKRELPPEIEKSKFREFYLKRDYDRPQIPLYNIWAVFNEIKDSVKTDNKNNTFTHEYIMALLAFDRYEFFTIEHIKSLNMREGQYYAYNMINRLRRLGFVHRVVHSWDLDDSEYKQRFGLSTTRHNYNKRYGLTFEGRQMVDKIYEMCAS